MPTFKPDRVVIHPDVEEVYTNLESAAHEGRSPEDSIWRSLQRALDRVAADGLWGEVIPAIPRYFAEKYQAKNLYCIDLARFHRAFYTIRGREVVLLDLVDHATYDKWFPGRRR
jgi:hypothetical protein